MAVGRAGPEQTQIPVVAGAADKFHSAGKPATS